MSQIIGRIADRNKNRQCITNGIHYTWQIAVKKNIFKISYNLKPKNNPPFIGIVHTADRYAQP
jgi:hypothetical protein